MNLTTQDLRLRPLHIEDRQALTILLRDPTTHPFIMDHGAPSAAEIPDWIARRREGGEHVYWAMEFEGALIGYIALHATSTPAPALSYAVLPDWRRRGFAGQAIRVVFDHACHLGAERVVARTHLENLASAKLLLGSKFRETPQVQTVNGARRCFERCAPKLISPRQGYDLWASSYDDTPNPMIAMVERELERDPLRPARVLELGCGTGRNLEMFATRGAQTLFGVDISEHMLERARARLPSQARLHHGDIRVPVAPAASFDLVLITLVLEHVEDAAPVFERAFEALAPGGRVCVMELHPSALKAGSRAKFLDDQGHVIMTDAFAHTFASWDEDARAAGFEGGVCRDVSPDATLLARFPSRKRRPDIPWLLHALWTRPT